MISNESPSSSTNPFHKVKQKKWCVWCVLFFRSSKWIFSQNWKCKACIVCINCTRKTVFVSHEIAFAFKYNYKFFSPILHAKLKKTTNLMIKTFAQSKHAHTITNALYPHHGVCCCRCCCVHFNVWILLLFCFYSPDHSLSLSIYLLIVFLFYG